jgi:hypothetical protein
MKKKSESKPHRSVNADCTAGSLPAKHFAILMEGAWIYSKPHDGNGILATCPITSPDHALHFGLWDPSDTDDLLSPVPGFGIKVMPLGLHFDIQVTGTAKPAAAYQDVFDQASMKYPFVYIKPSLNGAKKIQPKLSATAASTDLRTVRLPLPTSLRAAGCLTSATVGGNDTQFLYPKEGVKRAHVTYVFVYEYKDRISATVDSMYGTGEIYSSPELPNPHLIFKCFPVGMTQMDQSFEKNHSSDIFEALRQSVLCKDGPAALDIGLYHCPDNDMAFDCGDTGLTSCELGIPPCRLLLSDKELRAAKASDPLGTFVTKMAGCAGGGIVSG